MGSDSQTISDLLERYKYLFDTENEVAEQLMLSREIRVDELVFAFNKLLNLHDLDLSYSDLTDEGLSKLAVPSLDHLDLSGTHVTDSGLSELAAFKGLRELKLNDMTSVSDTGIQHISNLVNLESLWLRRTNISDTGIANLHHLTNLRCLSLKGVQTVTGQGFEALNRLPLLETLETGCNISEKGLEAICGLNKLDTLQVGGNFRDEAIRNCLLNFSELSQLSIKSSLLTTAAGHLISELLDLFELEIFGEMVDDQILNEFTTLEQLNTLRLVGTDTTTKGHSKFRASKPYCNLEIIPRTALGFALADVDAKVINGPYDRIEKISMAAGNIDEFFETFGCSLKEWPHLKELDLMLANLTNKSLEQLKLLGHLKKLSFSGRTTDEGIAYLLHLNKLEDLTLIRTPRITDKGLEILSQHNKLCSVCVLCENVSDTGIESLKSLRTLEKLICDSQHVSGRGLLELKNLPHLRCVCISSRVTRYNRKSWMRS